MSETIYCNLFDSDTFYSVPFSSVKDSCAHKLEMPPPDLAIPKQQPMDVSDDLEHNSTCDTASVASNLTRMCVSDEDEKVETDTH